MAVLASRLWDVEVKGYTAKLLYTLLSRRQFCFFRQGGVWVGKLSGWFALEAAVLMLLGHTHGYTVVFS